MNRSSNEQNGFVLIAVMILTFFVIMAGTVTAQLASSNLRAANIETFRVNAQFAADAGADWTAHKVNDALFNNYSWSGTGSEITVSDQSNFKTTFISTVTDSTISGQQIKIIKVTGKTYSPKTKSTPVSTRTYLVTLKPIEAGDFAVVTGVGGLIMENSAKIVGGSVFVNGKITMTGSSQIGLSNAPVEVFSAHLSCPLGGGPGYPIQCGAGNGEPISISNPAWIYGDVSAQNQTNGARMSNGGLQVGATVAPKALPVHDRTAQKNAVINDAAHQLSGASASCTTNNGTKTWPANTKITGNVTINKSCVVTVLGDIWITGSLTMAQSGTLKVNTGLTTAPVLMVDDTVDARNSAQFASNNSNPKTGFRVISYKNNLNDPDTVPAGSDLFTSSSIQSISLSQTSGGPNTEFYAKYSLVNIGNSGGIGAVTGQTIRLNNSAAVTFGTKIVGMPTIMAWVIESYSRDYTPL
ncbi:MAG: hypothetical protein WAW60_00300 [Candidatus Saccharimonadales bacterium]